MFTGTQKCLKITVKTAFNYSLGYERTAKLGILWTKKQSLWRGKNRLLEFSEFKDWKISV